MLIGTFKIEDLAKMHKTISLSRAASTVGLSIDGPKLLISYIGDDGKLVTITLFDASVNTIPTIAKTDYL